jgi:F420-dependent oxidoreductase-like protein
MKLGLTIADFTWPNGPAGIAGTLRRVATTAEDVGFARIGVMDHLWQIGVVGAAEREMVEAYTTLGHLAAVTSRVELLAVVTSASYREPGLLAKMVTTLDVLSEGRAWLGIGAGAPLNEPEARGLGLPLPPIRERFERLEETLRICRQMWSGDQSPFEGRHYQLGRTLNSPPPVRRPPILVGGSGEKQTLRLVATYADACNLFAGPDLPRKLDVLRAHCDAVGRDYADIEKSVLLPLDPGPRGRDVGLLLRRLEWLASIGIDAVYGPVPQAHTLTPLDLLGEYVVPAAAAL